MEIIAEPLKTRAEPVLKSTTETPKAPEKEPEVKESAPAPNTSNNNQDQSPVKPKEETSSPVVEAEKQEKTSPPEIKLESAPVADKTVDDDYVEDLGSKKNQTYLQPKAGTNLSATHGSTSSLDKDRMSIDSLDISNDRRHQSTTNIHDQ